MSDKSNYLKEGVINHLLRTNSLPKPPAVYVALFTVAPDPDTGAGGTEVSGGGYARVQVGPSDAAWDDPVGTGVTGNTSEVVFVSPTADLGVATHFSLRDALTGGNQLYSGALDAPRTLSTGVALKFPAGSLTVSEQ